jgi:glucose/mannose transport system substrate-binding protein
MSAEASSPIGAINAPYELNRGFLDNEPVRVPCDSFLLIRVHATRQLSQEDYRMRISLLFAALTVSCGFWPTPVFSLTPGEQKLEVVTNWNAGGDSVALGALIRLYTKANPDVEVISRPIGGTGGGAARAVLRTRLTAGNPPDTWQCHPGWELLGEYVEPGYCESISSLYQSEGWNQVFPVELVRLLSKKGNIYEVLAGIHRGNILWYNKKVLDKNGISTGDKLSFNEFLAACAKLEAAGISGLAVGDSEIANSAQVFEDTLLGVVGPTGLIDLFRGDMRWDDPKVGEAMKLYGRILDYQNPDHASMNLYGALREFMDGKAGFTCSGDWSYGMFLKSGQKPNVDFGWVCYPGTDGSFVVIADGFTLAKGAPDKEQALSWLKVIGSKEAQEQFNEIKGSIPARTDIDPAKFDAYHRWSMDSFAKDRLVPSCVHGEATPGAFQEALYDAVTQFVEDRDVDKFTQAMLRAAEESQP